MSIYGVKNQVCEWSICSSKSYKDPFNEIELDLVFTCPNGIEQIVPAFWSGDHTWTVHYAPQAPGSYSFQTRCSDVMNEDLHNRCGKLEVLAYEGENQLYRHGAIKVAEDHRHFEHADGTPFFWLADTWWSGLCKRFRWPEDFRLLTQDRVDKGFTVIQICACLPPIMDSFDRRGANEAGHPWEPNFARINPAYFDMADLRIQHLVQKGLMPCIIGAWGFNLLKMGIERMKRHWRYIISRWGAYPVVWILAGEGNMPWYLSRERQEDIRKLTDGWTEVGRYVRAIDPYHRLVSIHPSVNVLSARKCVRNQDLLDFDMLQTGHCIHRVVPTTINAIRESRDRDDPRMPVLDGEVAYEDVHGDCSEADQRFLFWACILSGSVCGYTYGADGIWQFNTETEFAGASPSGNNWGIKPWNLAYQLPGSRQMGISRKLLMSYPWWQLEPHQEWIEPHWDQQLIPQPFAAGIPGGLRIIYLPGCTRRAYVRHLEQDISYRWFFFNPITGKRHKTRVLKADNSGSWQVPNPPVMQDWVIVLEGKLPKFNSS